MRRNVPAKLGTLVALAGCDGNDGNANFSEPLLCSDVSGELWAILLSIDRITPPFSSAGFFRIRRILLQRSVDRQRNSLSAARGAN